MGVWEYGSMEVWNVIKKYNFYLQQLMLLSYCKIHPIPILPYSHTPILVV